MWFDELKKMKENSGLTTKQIAAGANLPEPTLEKIFSGLTKDPKLSTIYQLVHFLGYTLDDLTDKEKAPAQLPELNGDLVSTEDLTRLLVNLGFIRDGEDLTDDDFAFLSNIIGLLSNWFSRKGR